MYVYRNRMIRIFEAVRLEANFKDHFGVLSSKSIKFLIILTSLPKTIGQNSETIYELTQKKMHSRVSPQKLEKPLTLLAFETNLNVEAKITQESSLKEARSTSSFGS